MFRVSCIQLKSNNNINFNLKKTEKLILKAIKQKADLILTPEVSSLFSLNKSQLLKICTSMKNDIYLTGIKKLAKKYKKWILVGSLIIKINKHKLVNRSVLIDNYGKIRTYYDKIHMYDVTLSKNERYFESKTFTAGTKIKSFKLPWGKIGLSICYDLRFPNLYRKLSKQGAIFLSVPSAFTETLYFLEGEGIFTIGSKKHLVKAGDFVSIPPSVVHSFKTISTKPVKVLSIQAPEFLGEDRHFIKP